MRFPLTFNLESGRTSHVSTIHVDEDWLDDCSILDRTLDDTLTIGCGLLEELSARSTALDKYNCNEVFMAGPEKLG